MSDDREKEGTTPSAADGDASKKKTVKKKVARKKAPATKKAAASKLESPPSAAMAAKPEEKHDGPVDRLVERGLKASEIASDAETEQSHPEQESDISAKAAAVFQMASEGAKWVRRELSEADESDAAAAERLFKIRAALAVVGIILVYSIIHAIAVDDVPDQAAVVSTSVSGAPAAVVTSGSDAMVCFRPIAGANESDTKAGEALWSGPYYYYPPYPPAQQPSAPVQSAPR